MAFHTGSTNLVGERYTDGWGTTCLLGDANQVFYDDIIEQLLEERNALVATSLQVMMSFS